MVAFPVSSGSVKDGNILTNEGLLGTQKGFYAYRMVFVD
jgi:hypothetical protein